MATCMSVNGEYVRRLVADIKDSIRFINKVSSKPYTALGDAEKYAIRYNLIVIAEAIVALTIHIVRRVFSREPETPMYALKITRDKGLMTEDEYNDVRKLIRLRNLLLHRYWIIDDRRIYEDIRKDFKSLVRFIERVVKYVQ